MAAFLSGIESCLLRSECLCTALVADLYNFCFSDQV